MSESPAEGVGPNSSSFKQSAKEALGTPLVKQCYVIREHFKEFFIFLNIHVIVSTSIQKKLRRN